MSWKATDITRTFECESEGQQVTVTICKWSIGMGRERVAKQRALAETHKDDDTSAWMELMAWDITRGVTSWTIGEVTTETVDEMSADFFAEIHRQIRVFNPQVFPVLPDDLEDAERPTSGD